MSNIYKRIKADIIENMKVGNKNQVLWLRSLDAAIQTEVIDTREKLTDELVYRVVKRELKKISEEINLAELADRIALVSQKINERITIQAYAPTELPNDKVREIVSECVLLVGASSLKDMGKVMNKIRELYPSNIDMKVASSLVNSYLKNIGP